MDFTSSKKKILVKVDHPFFIITLNNPENLNALDGEDYVYLGKLLEEADNNNDIYFTILQGVGRYFSSGGDFSSIKNIESDDKDPIMTWAERYLSRDLFTCDKFYRHKKVLIFCLNGPAVGLSAALVALGDMVYSMNDRVFLNYPFSLIGLIAEGASSVSLPIKMGNNTALNKMVFSEPILYQELETKIITKNYQLDDVEAFNKQVIEDLRLRTKGLYLPSCLVMKNLIQKHSGLQESLARANSDGVNLCVPHWASGEPQNRFAIMKAMRKKTRSNKL